MIIGIGIFGSTVDTLSFVCNTRIATEIHTHAIHFEPVPAFTQRHNTITNQGQSTTIVEDEDSSSSNSEDRRRQQKRNRYILVRFLYRKHKVRNSRKRNELTVPKHT